MYLPKNLTYFLVSILFAGLISVTEGLDKTTHTVKKQTVYSNSIIPLGHEPKYEIDSVIAIVNDEAITLSDLNDEVIKIRAQTKKEDNAQNPGLVSLKKRALQKIIDQMTLLQTAKHQGVTVSDESVKALIRKMLVKNKITLDRLKAELKELHLNFENYFDTVKNSMVINKLKRNIIRGNIYISPKEIKKYVDTHFTRKNLLYKVRNIVLPLQINSTKFQEKVTLDKAQKIVNQIKAGKMTFSTAARKYSQSINSSESGYLGWKKISGLPHIYTTIVKTLRNGTISPPFIASGGVHIIKLENKKIYQDLKHSVDQCKIIEVIIQTSPILNDAQARAKLMKIIHKNSHFSLLHVQEHFQGYSVKKVGWSNTRSFPTLIATKIEDTQVNMISRPFQVGKTWRIIQVNGKRSQYSKAYDYQQATNEIFERNVRQILKLWMSSLHNHTYIEILDNSLKSPE
jgi:peptidyl-prolyl cis-trans isomerase SurA